MTEQDKKLLLKDLCARLPYGVQCEIGGLRYGPYTFTGDDVEDLIDGRTFKPYLRLISSMTEEEKKEFQACHCVYELHPDFQPMMCNLANELNMFDWLNAHHFDVRNLIGRGLAIDCTNLNIY